MQLEKDQTAAIRRIKCPLACSGVFHPIATDKNGKPYATCTDWGLTLWFNRGREGRIWWERYMPSETACPGCGRKVDPDAENPPDCPECGDPNEVCPECGRLLEIPPDHCEGCGWNMAEWSPPIWFRISQD